MWHCAHALSYRNEALGDQKVPFNPNRLDYPIGLIFTIEMCFGNVKDQIAANARFVDKIGLTFMQPIYLKIHNPYGLLIL